MSDFSESPTPLSLPLLLAKGKALLRTTAASLLYYSGQIKKLRDAANPTWRILMYHRVINPEDVPYPLQPGMYVRPETFDRQMRYLRSQCLVLPLDELAKRIAEGNPIEPRSVAITFDDGWLDNYLYAFPILRSYDLPATIFLATRFIGTTGLFWTDRLSLSVFTLWQMRSGLLNDLERGGVKLSPALENFLREIVKVPNLEQLGYAIDYFIGGLKILSRDIRTITFETIYDLSRRYRSVNNDRVFLDWEEIKQMSEHRIMFGSHSSSHSFLTELAAEQVRKEIEESLGALTANSLFPSSVFCYPGGEYNDTTQSTLCDLNFCYALNSSRQTDFEAKPVLLGRHGIHQDVSASLPLFTCRLWGGERF